MSTALVPAPNPEGAADDAVRTRILASPHASKVKAALLNVYDEPDVPLKHVAAKHDMDAEHLRRLTYRYGIAPQRSVLLAQARRLAFQAGLSSERALEDGEIKPAQAAIIYGIAHDKARAMEAGEVQGGGYEQAVSALVKQLGPGESLTITVARERAETTEPAEPVTVEAIRVSDS